jgi:hypothetical protein
MITLSFRTKERGSLTLTVYLYTLSDRLILKSPILDGYADFLILLNFVKEVVWLNGVIHLPIGLKVSQTGPLAEYSNFYTPRRKE